MTHLKVPAWVHSEWMELELAQRKAILASQVKKWPKATKQEKSEMMRMFMTVMGVMTLFMFVVALIGWYVAWWFTSDDPNPLNQLLLRGWRATSTSVTSLGRQVAQDPVGWGKQKVTQIRKIAEL